jgi:transposase InsO family protein
LSFQSRDGAFLAIAAWLDKYHTERPQPALGHLTPKEFAERSAA